MQVLLFNGSLETKSNGTGARLIGYFSEQLQQAGFTVSVCNLAEAHIPFFEPNIPSQPMAARLLCNQFVAAPLHIWFTPLYHGSMTGVMKNALDWLELTSGHHTPYLTGKIVGLVCWAEGAQAMQGINAMDAVAKALRAWVLPFSLPIAKDALYNREQPQQFSAVYQQKIGTMVRLLAQVRQQPVM